MTARRALGLAVAAAAGAAALHAFGTTLPTPPVTEPQRLADWWNARGTALATLSVVRALGLALCCYLAVISFLAALAALTRWRWATALTGWAATPALRRLLIGGSLAVALSAPQTAAASAAPFAVTDVGAVIAEAENAATDTGAADISRIADIAVEAAYDATDMGPVDPADAGYRASDIGPAPAPGPATEIGPAPAPGPATEIGPAPAPGPATEIGPASAKGQYAATDIGVAPAEPEYRVTDTGSAAPAEPGYSVSDIGGSATRSVHEGPAYEVADIGQDAGTGLAEDADSQPGRVAAAGADRSPAAAAAAAESDRSPAADEAANPGSEAEDKTWLVMPGDNLWGIAADTVAHRTGSAEPHTVLQYWLDLLEANVEVLGENPDLIYSGQILRLPALSGDLA